jgi:hypothetical protein
MAAQAVSFLLKVRAQRVVSAAAARLPVTHYELQAFARECIRQTPIGALALEVMLSPEVAPNRALELAALVLERR